jgi:hypothetical protein
MRSPCAAECVARKLVEQKDQCQRTVRRGLPPVELAAGGHLVGAKKGLAKATIERRVLGKPKRGAGFLPDCDYLLGARRFCLPGAFRKIPAGIKFLLNKTLAADGCSRGGHIVHRHISLQTRTRIAFPQHETLRELARRL